MSSLCDGLMLEDHRSKQDFHHVQHLAEVVRPAEESSYYTHIKYDRHQTALELVHIIRKALRNGHFVHISGYPTQPSSDEVHMTAESILNHFGTGANEKRTILGEG